MDNVLPESPRLRWPLMLMLLAAVVSVILIVVIMGQTELPPTGQTHQ
jgi:hypothetical protein